MSIFGWSYPPGAEFANNAPWNQDNPPDVEVDDCTAGEGMECPLCESQAVWVANIHEPNLRNKLTSPEPAFLGWICDFCGWKQVAISEDYKPGYKAEE